MKTVYLYEKGILAGIRVDGHLVPIIRGGDPGAGSSKDQGAAAGGMSWADPLDLTGTGARASANAQKDAAEKAAEATVRAAEIAAAAQKEAQDKAIAAQKEATEESVAAAKEAAATANQLIADANLLVEKYTQEGVDFSNTEAARSVEQIQGIFKDVYDKNVEGFQQTYNAIKQEYADGYRDIEKNLSGYMQTGEKANARLQDLSGVNGAEAGKNALITDPSYRWRVDQGRQAIERSAIGDKNLFSGKTAMALQDYGQGAASQEFSNAFNRLMALSEQGRSAVNTLSGYRWDKSSANAQNEGALGAAKTGARSLYGDKSAALQDYLSQTKTGNQWKLSDTRSQNALNKANVGTQGAWNVSSARAGGAQNNALVGINAANKVGDTAINNAWSIRDAETNQAYGDAAATAWLNQQKKNNAWKVVDTAASIYGGSKGTGAV